MSGVRCYATLQQLRTRQGLSLTDTADDPRLLAKLRAASQEMERYTSRGFQPIQETRTFDWEDANHLGFRAQEALTLAQVVDGQGRTISTSAIIPLGATTSTFGSSYGPFYALEIDPGKGDFLAYLTTKRRAIAVTGTWGWHDDYANAWHGSGLTVQDSPLSAGATSITTSTNDSTATDAWGQSSVVGTVSGGHLIQIDSEWIHVLSRIDATHLLVIRGVNGTTAVSHAQNAPISVYEPPRDIQDICARWAAWLYAQDSVDYGHAAMVPMDQKAIPANVPHDIAAALEPYVKRRVG